MKIYKVKKSKIDNQGVYAARNIKAGTKIIYYKGKIITKKETEKNPKYDNDKAIYLFNLNSGYDLDGDFKYNTARLINHSCNPNCEVDGKGLKLWIFSLRDIKKVKNYLMIMVSVLMKIISNFHVNADQKIAVVLLLGKALDGE